MRLKITRLKLAIVKSGQTQRWLAAESRVPESRLSTLANGWAEPREDERQAIAEVLGRSPDDLFAVEPAMPLRAAARCPGVTR